MDANINDKHIYLVFSFFFKCEALSEMNNTEVCYIQLMEFYFTEVNKFCSHMFIKLEIICSDCKLSEKVVIAGIMSVSYKYLTNNFIGFIEYFDAFRN